MAFHSFPIWVGKNSGCDVAKEWSIADSDFEQLRMCAQRTVGKIWHLAQKSNQRSTFVHDRSVCKMDVAGVTEKELIDRINSSGIDELR